MEKVFFIPGNLHVLDEARAREDGELVGRFCRLTLEEIQRQSPGAILGTVDEFLEQMEATCRTDPAPITEEQYSDALEVLPPQNWQGIGTAEESFKFLERYAGRVTTIYARLGNNHYRFRDVYTLPHSDIMAKVKAVQAALGRE